MPSEWSDLTRLTQGKAIVVERVRFPDTRIAIDGEFELPPLARLSDEDQVFVRAFIQCHGSIKDMEQMFGISYPTVKNRLNSLAERLKLVETPPLTSDSRNDVLLKLGKGEITVEEAIKRLSK